MKRALAVVAACGVCGAAFGQTLFGTIALTGDQVPGLDPGVRYEAFYGPFLNQNGQVAFRTRLVGAGTSGDDVALMVGRPDELVVAARVGDAVPGIPGSVLESVTTPSLGVGAVAGFFGEDDSGVGGIFVGAPGEIEPVLLEGQDAPGTEPGTIINTISTDLPLLRGGRTTCLVSLAGPTITLENRLALYRVSPNGADLIVRSGSPAPGLGAGVTLLTFKQAVLNASGHALFEARLAGVPSADQDSLWVADHNGLRLIARSGDAVPGLTDGEEFDSFLFSARGRQPFDLSGAVTIPAVIRGPSVTNENNQVLMRWENGAATVLSRSGMQAPSLPSGFSVSGPRVVYAPLGDTFISGALIDAGTYVGHAIWIRTDGTEELIARDAATVPGLPIDTTIAIRGGIESNYHGNREGRIVFGVNLLDASEAIVGSAVLTHDDRFGLSPVALTGQRIEVAPGDIREVLSVAPTTSTSGTPGDGGITALRNDGVLVLRLQFTDGSWAIVSARTGPPCRGDLTTHDATPGDPGFGEPDGTTTGSDLLYYVNAWISRDRAIADLTTTDASAGTFEFGAPDGRVTAADLQFFVNFWLNGCP